MKKFKFLFLLILFLSFVFIPKNVFAYNVKSKKIPINSSGSFDVNELNFTNVKYSESVPSYKSYSGITATITNRNDYHINFKSVVYFYDKNGNFMSAIHGQNGANGKIIGGKTDYYQLIYPSNNIDISNVGSFELEISYEDDDITSPSNKEKQKKIYEALNREKELNSSDSSNKSISSFNYYPYIITKYDVNMNVNSDNSFDITETIVANFNKSRHGIIRKLPLKNNVMREDGTSSTNRAFITNIDVSEKYTRSVESNNLNLKIGDPNKEITGSHRYKIKYKYSIGRDSLKGMDEFYYNIIGTEWDTTISNVTFTINMPKKFDKSKIGFSTGKKGVSGYNPDKLKYSVDGNKITGSFSGTLNKNEGLNIRLELPDKYFKSSFGLSFLDGFHFGLNLKTLSLLSPIILLVLAFFLWLFLGRDRNVVDPVTFYPPDGINSLEAGLIYKGEADNKDVTSLLIYLADKGYLTIDKAETIRKVKDYDGNNIYEEEFMNGLFSNVDEVPIGSLYNSFYKVTNKILKSVNSIKNRKKVISLSTLILKILFIIMIISIYFIVTLPAIYTYSDFTILNSTFIFVIVYIIPLKYYFIILFIGSNFGKKIVLNEHYKRILLRIFRYFIFIDIILCLLLLDAYWSIFLDEYYLVSFIVGMCSIGVLTILLHITSKRTKYGLDMLGKLKGFRNFLETAEKDELEKLVDKNPEYFYNILPYTYVLGVSSKWIDKFESINMKAPDWYLLYDDFTFYDFYNCCSDSMDYFNSAITTRDDTRFEKFLDKADEVADKLDSGSGGSGSSGGGSSGGGSGGGGGSSW